MFLSQIQIENCLNSLELVHPFFGINFLVAKQLDFPVGTALSFAINREEEIFLQKYFQPESDSKYFYRPFRVSDKSKFWLRPDYPWKGSQKLRTSTFGEAFIHAKGTDQWGWKKEYVTILKRHLYQERLIPAFALAVWIFREKKWHLSTTAQQIIDEFFKKFKINDIEQEELFDTSIDRTCQGDSIFSEHLFSWQELVEKLNIPVPDDAPKDEGGTLSALLIEGVGPAKKLDLHLAERINLFTGDNGLGKSFVLECAWWALSGNWTGFPAYPGQNTNAYESKISFEIKGKTGKLNKGLSEYNWEKQDWSLLEERPAIPGLLLYARVDGAFAVWDPARDYWPESAQRKFSRPLIFTRNEIWNGLQEITGGQTTFLSNGLIADWILWQNSPEKEPFATLKRVLKRLSPPDLDKGDLGTLEPGKPTRVSNDSRWMPTIKHSYGEVPLIYASAGVRRIVALAYLIVWAWEEHKTQSGLIRKPPQRRMVILVDEIEAHLHPQWQRKILPALLGIQADLAPELNVQLLIATHSPLLLSAVEPLFERNKDRIFHLNLVNKHSGAEVVLQEPEFIRYGTVNSWLQSEFFELAQPRSLEGEKAIEDAKKIQDKENVTRAEVAEVSDLLVKYLAAHDPFWPRWTFFAEEHGVEL
ncbi:MAG: AAA family ATPase [Candidatus Electrothrix sp. YB6]